MVAAIDRAESPSAHLPALDGLRAVAVALVLYYHALFVFQPQVVAEGIKRSPLWAPAYGGWIGVDLFFALSGFLITRILQRTRHRPGWLKTFWARRALRIVPLAYLYLAVLGADVALGDPLGVLRAFPSWPLYALYVGNLHIVHAGWQPLVVMPLWSLAVEEQFYAVWPWVVGRCGDGRAFLGACLALLCLAPGVRLLIDVSVGYPATYVHTLARLDPLVAGAALAVLLEDPRTRPAAARACRWLAPCGAVVIACVLWFQLGPSLERGHPRWFTTLGFSAVAVGCAGIVGWAATAPASNPVRACLCLAPLRGLGRISYGIYVWQCLVGGALQTALASLAPSWGFHARVTTWVALTVGVAALSWVAYERPLLRLKTRFPPPATT